jgi:tetratricopeptide (TPR) repeat protein
METAFLRHLNVEGRHLDSVNDAGDAPFSDLISRWLDEGERLSEMGEAVAAAAGLPAERRLPAALARVRSKAERHRTATFVFAVTLSVGAIGLARGFMHGVLAAGAPAAEAPLTVTATVTAAAPTPTPTPTPPPTLPPPTPAAVAVAIPAPAPVAVPEVVEPEPEEVVEPTSSAATAPIASEPDHVNVCRKALRNERTKQALVACRRAAEANPTSADAVVLMAHADLLAGRQEETLRLARKASALDPGCAEAYLLIGNVEQTAGSKLAARSAYQAYLDHAPRGPHAAEVRAILRTL